jgi:transposase
MGDDRSERLDVLPAKFRVIVTRRPKYACRRCEEVVVQAPAPARLVEGDIPTEATVAHVLVAKYADHLPLYRQAQILGRQGVNLDRSTLADWVGKAAFLLRPLHERLFERLKASPKLFADETTAPVLDPGRGRTKTGQLFAYARDDRPWGGSDPPGVAFLYAPDRKAENVVRHLAGFAGILQVDGYTGYRVLHATTVGREEVGGRWWVAEAERPLVPHRRPQPRGSSLAGGQDLGQRVVGMDPRASVDVHLDRLDQRLQGGGDRAHQSASVETSTGMPSRPMRSLCGCSGRCSPNFEKATSATRFALARLRLIGWNGAGGWVFVSRDRQENFSRTCWMTNQRAGTRSNVAVTSSPNLLGTPPATRAR